MRFSYRTHRQVIHPRQLAHQELFKIESVTDALLDVMAHHLLGSRLASVVAVVTPILFINASTEVKIGIGFVSGTWIQWWALHILQRRAIIADRLHDAKSDADHLSLTYLCHATDDILKILKEQSVILESHSDILSNNRSD